MILNHRATIDRNDTPDQHGVEKDSSVIIVIATVPLLGWSLVKAAALLNALKWARQHSVAYERDFRSRRPSYDRALYALFAHHDATFWPFGAKSYKLRRVIDRISRKVSHIVFLRLLLRVVSWPLISASGFIPLSMLVLEVQNAMAAHGNVVLSAAGWSLAFVLLIYSIGLVGEATCWYVAVKRYAEPYFLVRPSASASASPQMDELIVFAILAAFTIATASVLVSTTAAQFGGFSGLPEGQGLSVELQRLIMSAHYVVATISTMGDATVNATSLIASFDSLLIIVAGLILLTFGVAIVSTVLMGPTQRSR